MQKEGKFKHDFLKKVEKMMPESIIMKNGAGSFQGIPDTLILNDNKWAALEFKRDSSASHRPNQDYYVDKMNAMSFAAFVYPENEKEILDALQRTLQPSRSSRVSKP